MGNQNNIMEEYEKPPLGSCRNRNGKLQQKAKRQTTAYKSAKAHKRRMAANSRKANRSKN